MSYGRISGAFIPAPSRAILANFGAPAKVCEAKVCGEKEKVLHDFRRGASDRNRTNDTGIFSPLLYRLSYRGITGAFVPAPSRSVSKRGPRKCLRSKDLWGRGGNLAFITQALLARIADEQQDFRRSDPDRARTDDPQRDRLVL